MITRDPDVFLGVARAIVPEPARSTARAAFLVAPEQFELAEQSASDNRYMDLAAGVDPARAAAQHGHLHQALAGTLPTLCFPGDARTPDAIFPNNVFATVAPRGDEPGRLVLGHMRHPVRQAEAGRADIRRFFTDVLGYRVWNLATQPGICELTGSLVIDQARRIGYCGLSERCDAVGAAAMHAAFGLRATLLFELARGEYHTNVVLSVLAGKAVVVAPDGFALARVADAIADLYAPHVVVLSKAQKQAFAGNCLALAPDQAWMSETADRALHDEQRAVLRGAGLRVRSVPLDELEKAGGSLRCCVAELY